MTPLRPVWVETGSLPGIGYCALAINSIKVRCPIRLSIPDADQNVFTVGLGFKFGHNSFEGAYGLDFYDDRNITNDQNPAFDGKYTFNVHLFSLAYRYSF